MTDAPNPGDVTACFRCEGRGTACQPNERCTHCLGSGRIKWIAYGHSERTKEPLTMGYHHPRHFRPFGYKTWAAVGADCRHLNQSLRDMLSGSLNHKDDPGYEVKLCNGQVIRVRPLSPRRNALRLRCTVKSALGTGRPCVLKRDHPGVCLPYH